MRARIKQITHGFKCKRVNFIAPLLNKMHTDPKFSFKYILPKTLDTGLRSDLPLVILKQFSNFNKCQTLVGNGGS